MKWLKSRIKSIKEELYLGRVILIHLILIFLHIMIAVQYHIEYHADLRVAGCTLVILISFLFGRKGYAIAILIYSCALLYVNSFYNYGSAFFLIIAYSAYPKIKPQAIVLFLLNMLCSFDMQRLPPAAGGIQICYWLMYETLKVWLFTVNPAHVLNLTEDEKQILNEMLEGKKQKEIEVFSQPTITAKLKSARERNLCETTADLLAKYARELN